MNFLRRVLGRRASVPAATRNRAVAAAVLISSVARAAFFPASAQTPGVAGLVHDSIGRPIPGVEVGIACAMSEDPKAESFWYMTVLVRLREEHSPVRVQYRKIHRLGLPPDVESVAMAIPIAVIT